MKKAIFYVPDNMDLVVDRRIYDQIRLLHNLNVQTFVVALGNENQLRQVDQATALLLETRNLRSHDLEMMKYLDLDTTSTGMEDLKSSDFQSIKKIFNEIQSKLKAIIKRILPRKIKTIIFNLLWGGKLFPELKSIKPFWLQTAFLLCKAVDASTFDYLIGVDLPGALAAYNAKKENKKAIFWFDAHEYYSEQSFLLDLFDYEEAKKIEQSLVRSADIFTCVSEGLTKIMSERSERVGKSITLNNSTPLNISAQSTTIPIANQFPGKKILLFHGGLSDVRGISEIVEKFSNSNDPDWLLILMGYWPSEKLQKLVEKSTNVYLLPPVPVEELHSRIYGVTAILIPYSGSSDLNTKHCFPNKLGDAFALKIPILFDSSLVEIQALNRRYSFGIEYSSTNANENSFETSINLLSGCSPNWNKIEMEIGWKKSESILEDILSTDFSGDN